MHSFHALVEELEHIGALEVAGIQVDEGNVLGIEAQPELNGENFDDVGVQIKVNTPLSRLSMG